MINDNTIKELHKDRLQIRRAYSKEILEYLQNRYSDSLSLKETIWRILHNIEERPKCKCCGKDVLFVGRKNNIFAKTCSKECTKKIKSYNAKEFYKNASPEKIKEIIKRHQQTCLERYGVKNVWSLPHYKEKGKLNTKSKEIAEKIRNTCLMKYGVSHPMKNKEIIAKAIENRNKNGWASHWAYDNPMKHEKIKEKAKLTNQNKYGGNSPTCDPIVHEKQIQSRYLRYGKYTPNITKLKKYLNKENITIDEINHYLNDKDFLEYLHQCNKDIIKQSNNTKRKKGNLNTSKLEQETYKLLLEKFSDTIKEYVDENRYPFRCDFYIPSKDLFIECQYHWTHGNHPYNEQDINDIKLAEELKNSESEYKRNAWHTWTTRDTNKRNIAKKNNLNYLEFFSIKEFRNWLNNQ